MNGIRHTKTSPYDPSTNGLAERYVREFKNLLRKNNGKDDLETNLQSFLFAHRAFPQTVIKDFPGGTANKEKIKIKILEFNTKMRNPREVFHEAVRRQEQFTTGCEVYFRNYATGPKRDQQRETRLSICKDLIETANNDSDFLKTIITGYETWCFLIDPQTKKPSLEWHKPSSPRKKKVRLDKSKGKVMLVVFFEYQELFYYEIIKEGVTINKQADKEILVRLRDLIRRKRNQLFKSKHWKLLHDNAPAHRAIIVQDYLAKHSVSILPHPPYSPDIAPCDFFFFPNLKVTLKERRFSSSSEVIENATVELNKLRKIDFELAFQQIFSRRKKM
ncbi:hypothetical protein LAZ67_4002933 [Cordylochernes scorpioides]|uniref:Transposase n=1 Tax=Cordylochernes scorpioides TaxID=51811 RepID=A0ABY6KHY5_9ARAC|nr:hypothetical protein LAZ67_4002933 [Cordylochernes scorpioides]